MKKYVCYSLWNRATNSAQLSYLVSSTIKNEDDLLDYFGDIPDSIGVYLLGIYDTESAARHRIQSVKTN